MRPHQDPSSCDHEAARLLPWFVAGALSEREIERVQEHMHECPVCAADWEREQRVQSLLCDEPTVEHAPQPGLQKLMSRIDELERELPAPHEGPVFVDRRVPPRMSPMRWLAAAAIVQTIGLGILGVLLWQRGIELHSPRFQTMTSASAAVEGGTRIRVVFAPAMPVGELQALLKSISATVVAGPSDAGVYTLALSDEHAQVRPALETLRANGSVMFAEPQSAVEPGK